MMDHRGGEVSFAGVVREPQMALALRHMSTQTSGIASAQVNHFTRT